jgi:tetratricopeptide (TPR) repeat protein
MSKSQKNDNIFNLKDGKPFNFEKKTSGKKDGTPQIRSMAVSQENAPEEKMTKSIRIVKQFLAQKDEIDFEILEEAILIWPQNFFAWALKADYSEFDSEAYVFYKEAFGILDEIMASGLMKESGDAPHDDEFVNHFCEIGDKYAYVLSGLGMYREAASVYEKIIAADPADTYMLRNPLMIHYLLLEEREKFRKLYLTYKDDYSVHFLSNKLLFEYTESPESLSTQAALSDALEVNRYVPEKLGNWVMWEPNDAALPGSPEEGENMAMIMGKYWDMFPGAIRWLRDEAKKRKIK